MKKRTLHRLWNRAAAVLLLAACTPNLPGSALPTMDPTLIAVAAEATVTAMARANAATAAADAPASTAAAATAAADSSSSIATASAPGGQATAAPLEPSDFWVVYITKNKLAAVNGDGTQKAQLTNTPGRDYLPIWSPDGKTLAFIRFDGSNLVDGTLHLLPAGSNTPRILDVGNTYSQFFWTRDSQGITAVSGSSDDLSFYLLDANSSARSKIAEHVTEFPRLSPDGKQVAFLMNMGSPCSGMGCTQPNDIYLYDLTTRQTTRLTSDDTPKMALNWSPDGTQLVYHREDEGSSQVEILQADGKVIASRADPPWWRDFWLRSPVGSLIAYYVNDTDNGAVDIYTMPASGSGEPRKVIRIEKTGETAAYIDTFRWRPDGTGFIFNLWTAVNTVNLDGSNLRALPVTLENIFFDVRPTVDTFTPAAGPTPPTKWALCPGALESRLDVGRQASVTTDPPVPNNVRNAPAKTGQLVGKIQPGEMIEIIGGPVCDKGMIWWEIKSLNSSVKGYTVEGDMETYWLVPEP